MHSIAMSCKINLNHIFGVGKELAHGICRALYLYCRRYHKVFAIVLWGKCLHNINCTNIEIM